MLLQTHQLSRSFQRSGSAFFAVQDVEMSIDRSDFVFIVGRSGSGKTTLLNLIAGLLEPTSGTVMFNERDITRMNDSEKSHYRNELIGFVPQSLGTLPNLSVIDNVRVPFFLFDRDGDTEGRALSLLEMMGILHLKDEFPNNLSGGEAKRMLIARALMNSPQLLIADEPTANLDAETAAGVMHAVKEINRLGTAVLIVTHDTAILDPQCTTYRMDGGHLSIQT
ncbi:MAG: ABC transporter ATP-binding protein [Treponema sp.]|uniref:ABC transporter ATP-binding protein n=1 Tax=Treponema sp. TaxID=166 RepID=UPI003FA211F8